MFLQRRGRYRLYPKSALKSALEAVREEGMTVSAAADKFAIPESTVRYYIKCGRHVDATEDT